jgi:hypothetical protein
MSSFAATDNCKYVLSSPLDRNQKTLKRKIFSPGNELLRDYFRDLKPARSKFYHLSEEQLKEFVSSQSEVILENLSLNGVELESIANSKTYFAINGGKGRLGRVAGSLKKMGINVFLDFEMVSSAGIYMYDYKTIVLGLEEALYPNEISFHFLNLVQHAWNYEQTLTVPLIFDRVPTKTIKAFAIDEVLVFEKEIFRTMNLKNALSQNVMLSFDAHKNLKIDTSLEVFRELSMRVLLKKFELLKIVNYLKQIEKDPSLLQNEEFHCLLEELAPEVIVDIHASDFIDPVIIQKKAKASIVLIEKVIRIAEKVFE